MKHRNTPNAIMRLQCEVCKSPFDDRGYGARLKKYCSIKCRDKAGYHQKRAIKKQNLEELR